MVDDTRAGAQVHLGHDPGDEGDEGIAAGGESDREQLPARGVDDLGNLSEFPSPCVEHLQADQLVIVELVRVVGLRQRGRVDQQEHAPQCIGGVPVRHTGQAHEKPPGMVPGGFYGDLTVRDGIPLARPAEQAGAHSETVVRGVGVDVHHEFTADAVRFDDATHDELHDVLPVRVRSSWI